MDFFRVHLKVAIESSDSDIAGAGAKFLDDIESLFDRLVELESLPQEAKYETERSLRGVRLLEYLKERGKMDLYRKYTFYLCQMHADLDNKVEFANAVLLIANDMEWNEENQTPFQDNVFNFPAQTSTQRKISMYQRAIAAFDAAQNWEASVQVCKDLAEAYEYVIFNHHLLIETHNKISNYWQSILNTDRIFNSYYRVAFYGAGYAHMKCTEFVYKSGAGLVLESVRDFTMRIKAKFPDAHVENSSDLPKDKWLPGGEEEKDRYIQITTLNCSNREQLEGKTPWYLTTGLPGNVMKYYENSETDVWTFTRVDKTRKAKKGENEYRSLWVYRMYIIGQLELPSYSRCIEVVERKEVLICPLENAVNVLNEKNMEMKQIIKRIKTKASTFHGDDKENPVSTQLGPLSMNLSGVIDAAVMGGVEKYREAFFDGSYVKEFPSHAHYIPKFRQAMKDQVEILKSGLDVFGRYCQESLLPLSDHLTGTYRKMKNSLQWMDEVDVSGLEGK
jgi:hypothetical protein